MSDSALSELLDSIRIGNGTDLVRQLAEVMVQELIAVEASIVIGAAHYERTTDRTSERNGHRPKVLSTKAWATRSLTLDVMRGGLELMEGPIFRARKGFDG